LILFIFSNFLLHLDPFVGFFSYVYVYVEKKEEEEEEEEKKKVKPFFFCSFFL